MSNRSPPPGNAGRRAVLPGLSPSPDDVVTEAEGQGQQLWTDYLRQAGPCASASVDSAPSGDSPSRGRSVKRTPDPRTATAKASDSSGHRDTRTSDGVARARAAPHPSRDAMDKPPSPVDRSIQANPTIPPSAWATTRLFGGTVKLSGVRLGGAGVVQISVPDDDAPRPALRWLSLPRRDHQLCGLAVFPVPVKPAHGRRDAGGSRPFGHLRDGPAIGPEIRPGIRQPPPSASSPPRRQMAP